MLELLRGEHDIVRVGHRGAAALAPENSLAAIEAAAGHGMDMVEVDVNRRADGALVLAHGPTLPPDAPLLDEGLELAARLGLTVQLDVKVPGLAGDIVAALRRSGLFERSFVSSFSLATLEGFAREEPALPRSFTYPDDRLGLSTVRALRPVVRAGLAALRASLPLQLPRRLRSVGAAGATLNWSVADRRAIELCHRLGVAVYVWTVNDAKIVRTLLETGADGIITDDPRLLPRPVRP
jgi:glycerophosphoryl diester phosphodiesterase